MQGTARINLSAIIANFQALNIASNGKASAVVKANSYGLGAKKVVEALRPHCDVFFVATPNEAKQISSLVGDGIIYDLSGTSVFQDMPANVRPVINTMVQLKALKQQKFALQFNTGMNRLGLQDLPVGSAKPSLILSHLACADDKRDPQNGEQLKRFNEIAMHFEGVPKSLANSEGIFLGDAYHFDMVRPGIGLYGGYEFEGNQDVLNLELPIIQVHNITAGDTVGYGASYIAKSDMRLATVLGGYADGFMRSLGNQAILKHDEQPCPVIGRVSMDCITVDITRLPYNPESLQVITSNRDLTKLARNAGTITYEILTSLGDRYKREYV